MKSTKNISLEKKILLQMLTRYTIEKSPDKKWWWILEDNHVLICEVYTRKHAEQIRRLLSFDDKGNSLK